MLEAQMTGWPISDGTIKFFTTLPVLLQHNICKQNSSSTATGYIQ